MTESSALNLGTPHFCGLYKHFTNYFLPAIPCIFFLITASFFFFCCFISVHGSLCSIFYTQLYGQFIFFAKPLCMKKWDRVEGRRRQEWREERSRTLWETVSWNIALRTWDPGSISKIKVFVFFLTHACDIPNVVSWAEKNKKGGRFFFKKKKTQQRGNISWKACMNKGNFLKLRTRVDKGRRGDHFLISRIAP